MSPRGEITIRKATEHGGTLGRGRRKIARPIAVKRPMLLMLRSSRARGAWSMLASKHKNEVRRIAESLSAQFGLKLLRLENMGHRLHLLVEAKRRKDLQDFLRVLPQRLMFALTGARKGNAQGRFWDALVYSRILEGVRELKASLWEQALELLAFKSEERRIWKGT